MKVLKKKLGGYYIFQEPPLFQSKRMISEPPVIDEVSLGIMKKENK